MYNFIWPYIEFFFDFGKVVMYRVQFTTIKNDDISSEWWMGSAAQLTIMAPSLQEQWNSSVLNKLFRNVEKECWTKKRANSRWFGITIVNCARTLVISDHQCDEIWSNIASDATFLNRENQTFWSLNSRFLLLSYVV